MRGFARFAGDFHAAMIEFGDAVVESESGELVAVGAKGIRFDDLRAGFDVGLVDAKDGFGVRGIQFVDGTLRADGLVEKRAHGAIGDEDGVSAGR